VNDMLAGPLSATVKAPSGAVLSLVFIVVSAVLLTIGWRLAVQRRFEAHRWVQTAAVCLNSAVVLAWMIRSFVLYVVPAIPHRLGQDSYALTTSHAAVGAVGLVLGVFVVLRGNDLVPAPLRFSNYKAFMRSAYALYMLGTLMGVAVYVAAYVGI
jgi:putative membrane protein